MTPIPQVSVRVDGVKAAALDVAQHEVRQRAARVSSINTDAAARVAGVVDGAVAQFDVRAELQKVPAALPRKRVDKLIDLIGAVARPDLALNVKHAESAFRPADRDARWTVVLGHVRDTGKPHHAGDVKVSVVRRAEDF